MWRQGFQSGPKMGKWYLLFYMETEILGFQCYWYLLFYMETGIWGFPCYWYLLFYTETEIFGFLCYLLGGLTLSLIHISEPTRRA